MADCYTVQRTVGNPEIALKNFMLPFIFQFISSVELWNRINPIFIRSDPLLLWTFLLWSSFHPNATCSRITMMIDMAVFQSTMFHSHGKLLLLIRYSSGVVKCNCPVIDLTFNCNIIVHDNFYNRNFAFHTTFHNLLQIYEFIYNTCNFDYILVKTISQRIEISCSDLTNTLIKTKLYSFSCDVEK